jgi:hypothetical protein
MKRAREGEENDVSNVKRFKQDTDDPQDPKPVVQELTEDVRLLPRNSLT